MILVATLNPLVDYRLSYPTVHLFKHHRNPIQNIIAGGKGINVSRQLKKFGINSLNITFLGGNNGRNFKSLIEKDELQSVFIKTESETRISSTVIDESKKEVTTFFSANQYISKKEADEFYNKLEKMIPNCEILVLSGSSPSENCDEIFPQAIELAIKHDKIVFLDTYGKHLIDSLNSSPTIFHCNVEEVQSSLNLSLTNEDEKRNFLFDCYNKGVKQVFLTDGAESFYSSQFDYHYKIEPPQISSIDSTGSGDAFFSGVVKGIYEDLVYEDVLRFATAAGAANAMTTDVCNLSLNEIEQLIPSVRVSQVGKKMKLIDVTPN